MILRRFRVERILGHGGMGEVLLAQDTLLNRRVALKRLRSDGPEGPERRAAILKEARRASAITDRRIAAIHDVLNLDDDVLIVMEFVPGSTLRERMTGPMPIEEFWPLALSAVDAVGAAHAHGLIHRDIKPENLMVTGESEIKILDFGIARRFAFPDSPAGRMTTTTTTEARSVTIAGTPQYMAPEAHYGGRLDRPTDVFSLGVVFYEMLTGRQPFAAASYGAVLDQVMNTAPPSVSDSNPAVGPGLSRVVARMLEKDPGQRHATCGELMQELVAARTADAIAPAAAASDARRPRLAAYALASLAVATLGFIVWKWLSPPALPSRMDLAVLAPATPGGADDFASFALGATELLAARLQRQQDRPGFQVASFSEGFDENVRTSADARKVLGASLALLPALEQGTDRLRARLELRDTAGDRVLRQRVVEAPVSEPFRFLDRVVGESAAMLGLEPERGAASAESGVNGSGTLRFLLQGIGRRRAARSADDLQRAVADLELACRTEPEAGAPRAWLAAAQYKMNDLTRDRSWLERARATAIEATTLDSTRAEAYRILGNILATQRDMPGALEAFARARRLNPGDDEACLRLGRTHGRLGQRDEELSTYRAVEAERPHCWTPWWWIGSFHFREGQVPEAIHAFRQMIRRAPDLNKGYSSLGGLLVLQGDYAAAIDTLRRSVALRPTKVAFDNLGTACFNSGRLEDAIAAYNQSFQFGFADYGSWLNLGDAYFWLRNRPDQAREAYAQAIRLGYEEERERSRSGGSFDVMIPANLSTVFPKLDQPDSARFQLGRALRADSTNSMVQYCAALTLWQLGDRARALAWLRRSVAGGYPVAWLRDSPVFKEWRDEAAFQAIVAPPDSTHQPVAAAAGGGRR